MKEGSFYEPKEKLVKFVVRIFPSVMIFSGKKLTLKAEARIFQNQKGK